MTVAAQSNSASGRFGRGLNRMFPDRQILLRTETSFRSLTLSRRTQLTAVSLLFGLGAWAAFTTTHYTFLAEILAAKDQEVVSAEEAYQDILGQFARHRSRLQVVNHEVQRLSEVDRSNLLAVRRMSDRTAELVDASTRLIERTGLKTERLMKAAGISLEAQGGPYIEVAAGASSRDQLNSEIERLEEQLRHWAQVQGVVRRLPLNPPLDAFAISSGFGKRRDPINRRRAVHHGLDMIAPLKSPVFATSAGVVTFSGINGKYGRFIEIEHGAGLRTRFGHLHKLLVKKGEVVKPGQKIALLGNSGRSTGAHLHYEVRFKNKPRNPMKFIQAGRHVFQE